MQNEFCKNPEHSAIDCSGFFLYDVYYYIACVMCIMRYLCVVYAICVHYTLFVLK